MRFIADIERASASATTSPRRRSKGEWLETSTYVAAYQQRFLYLLSGLERKVQSSASTMAGIQNHSVHCYQLSMAFSKLMLVRSFAEAVQSPASLSSERLETSAAALQALRSLCHLFALTQLQQDAGEFMESGAIAPSDMPLVRENIELLLRELRPHAVALVDGFNFSDRTLNSALGRYDGEVYEALYETTKLDRLNKGEVGVDAVSGDGAVALRELLLPIRQEIERLEGEQRARL
jgi:acyl-CoA oxidase